MPRMTAAAVAGPLTKVGGYGVDHVKVAEGLGGKAIGAELDNVTPFEDLDERREDAPTAVVALLD